MRPGFEIPVNVTLNITDDIETGLLPIKASLGFYIGGMGAKGQNYHTKLMPGWGTRPRHTASRTSSSRASATRRSPRVPDSFADEISLVGPPERIRDRLAAWEDSPITMLNVAARDPETLRRIAEVVLG